MSCRRSAFTLSAPSHWLACLRTWQSCAAAYQYFHHPVSGMKGLISAMQSDPDLLSRTESEVQQLAQEVDKLRLAMQSKSCNGQ